MRAWRLGSFHRCGLRSDARELHGRGLDGASARAWDVGPFNARGNAFDALSGAFQISTYGIVEWRLAMPSDEAASVIFFVMSLYGFGAAVLYALARAWERALSTRSGDRRSAQHGHE